MVNPTGSALQLFLHRLMMRSVLSVDEQSAILALPGQLMDLAPRRDFGRTDSDGPYIHLVADGLIASVGQTSSGTRQTTALHIPGDVADLYAVVRPDGLGSLTALSEASVYRIPYSAIRLLALRHTGIAEAFWRDCMVDAAILTRLAVNIGRRDARARLAHLLCEIAIRYGALETNARSYHFPVTQDQLVDVTAMTGVHLNRTLKNLRAEGLVEIRASRVHILHWDVLARVGDFDPSI
jgi:CRP-like cAMP-binding protein